MLDLFVRPLCFLFSLAIATVLGVVLGQWIYAVNPSPQERAKTVSSSASAAAKEKTGKLLETAHGSEALKALAVKATVAPIVEEPGRSREPPKTSAKEATEPVPARAAIPHIEHHPDETVETVISTKSEKQAVGYSRSQEPPKTSATEAMVPVVVETPAPLLDFKEIVREAIPHFEHHPDDTVETVSSTKSEEQAVGYVTSTKLEVPIGHENWEDDGSVTHCRTCNAEFGMCKWKHHCRGCGLIFCNECTSSRIAVHRSHYSGNVEKMKRVCTQCFKSNDDTRKYLETVKEQAHSGCQATIPAQASPSITDIVSVSEGIFASGEYLEKVTSTKSEEQAVGRVTSTKSEVSLGHENWEDDGSVTHCRTCSAEFGVCKWKHHCRGCGLIFCNDCTSSRITVHRSHYSGNVKKMKRVCTQCFQSKDATQKYLETVKEQAHGGCPYLTKPQLVKDKENLNSSALYMAALDSSGVFQARPGARAVLGLPRVSVTAVDHKDRSRVWLLEDTIQLGTEITMFDHTVPRLDVNEYSSVTRALEDLNTAVLRCVEGVCIVHSSAQSQYFLLVREDQKQQGQLFFEGLRNWDVRSNPN